MKKSIEYFATPDGFPKISYGDKILFLGSCFSNSMGDQLRYFGFDTLVNPLGVVFHPLALAKQIENALKEDFSGKIFINDDIHLHSLASSDVYGLDQESLNVGYGKQLKELHSAFKKCHVLFVTFGSMHGYWLKETNEIVANCHKQSQAIFDKRCSGIDEVVAVWKNTIAMLRAINPEIQIVFTVSPVRYTRDGVLENVLSKSRLVEVCYQLGEFYFPSFELIQDVLRDFSFFEPDASHPNQKAIDEVWRMFSNWTFSEATGNIYQKMKELRTRESHRILFPGSKQAMEFEKITNEKREQLRSLFPSILF